MGADWNQDLHAPWPGTQNPRSQLPCETTSEGNIVPRQGFLSKLWHAFRVTNHLGLPGTRRAPWMTFSAGAGRILGKFVALPIPDTLPCTEEKQKGRELNVIGSLCAYGI